MVIESLKAAQSALKEAMKDKDMSDASRKKLQESDAALQKLLEEARKAAEAHKAKEAYQGEEEAGMDGEEAGKKGEEEESMPEPGHTMTITHKKTVKHDGPAGEEEEDGDGNDGDKKDEMDAEESKRGYIRTLLKEAGIPKQLWSLDKLVKLTLAEAKAEIAEKKALLETVRKTVETDITMVPVSAGEPLHESETTNLNGLFEGCSR